MKKIKISELPLFSSLKGLYTLGTDSANRSVKVSLEFIESATTEAVNKANAATEAAVTAKENAETATQNANAATTAANNAADAAMTAKENADTATGNANDAAQAATQAKTDAETATQNANTATAATQQAKKDAEAAEYAAERVITLIGQLVPTSLTVDSVPRLTIGNVQPVYINASLTPSQVMKNLIFISDGKALTVKHNRGVAESFHLKVNAVFALVYQEVAQSVALGLSLKNIRHATCGFCLKALVFVFNFHCVLLPYLCYQSV